MGWINRLKPRKGGAPRVDWDGVAGDPLTITLDVLDGVAADPWLLHLHRVPRGQQLLTATFAVMGTIDADFPVDTGFTRLYATLHPIPLGEFVYQIQHDTGSPDTVVGGYIVANADWVEGS